MSDAEEAGGATPVPRRAFSPRETARALNSFLRTYAAWGAWGQMASLQSAAFIGYALWLGVNEADIARFTAFASLATLSQLITSRFLARRIRRAKAFIFGLGFLHILCRFLIGLVPVYLAVEYRAAVIGLLVLTGIGCWHLVSPFVSEWQSRLIPEDIRARFLGRQAVAHLVAGIAASYMAGLYLDRVPEGEDRYTGFLTVFSIAALISLAGYINLTRIPFGAVQQGENPGNLAAPFRDRRFRPLLVFFLLWNFAYALASPFYSIFMIQTLGINYTTIAVLTSLYMGAMMLGSTFIGGLVDRFGSKAILQVLAPPMIFTPILWVFNRPDNYILIPFVMVLNGLLFSGILVAVNALLFGHVSAQGRDRTTYFASWSVSINLAYVAAPFIGGALVEAFRPIQFVALGYPIGNLQLMFLISAAAMVPCSLLLRGVTDAKATTPGALLGQVGRGNLLAYVYSSLVYEHAASAGTRARAAIRMGRSRSPMALGRLIQALDDPSPEVRRQAARGLGEAGSTDAVDPLVHELRNSESDVRPEAAEALGKIGDRAGVDPLIDAFYDPDTRVQISAIRALSEIGGDDLNELLFWRFAEQYDPATFPTLADVLGRAGDVRTIGPVLDRLPEYQSSAIRLQLLNAVCRSIGGGEGFYRLLSQDDLSRAEQMHAMVAEIRKRVRRTRLLADSERKEFALLVDSLRDALDDDESALLEAGCREVVGYLQNVLDDERMAGLSSGAADRLGGSALAVTKFLDIDVTQPPGVRSLFFVVCLGALSSALADNPAG